MSSTECPEIGTKRATHCMELLTIALFHPYVHHRGGYGRLVPLRSPHVFKPSEGALGIIHNGELPLRLTWRRRKPTTPRKAFELFCCRAFLKYRPSNNVAVTEYQIPALGSESLTPLPVHHVPPQTLDTDVGDIRCPGGWTAAFTTPSAPASCRR